MSEHEYVYLILHEHGYVKIGKAKDPYSRFNSIKTGSPYNLRLWKVARCFKYTTYLDHGHLEDYLHSELEEYNVRGEWFDVDPVEAFQTLARSVREDGKPGIWMCDAEDRIERFADLGRRMSEVF